jgi:hypothetical protein
VGHVHLRIFYDTIGHWRPSIQSEYDGIVLNITYIVFENNRVVC